MTKIFTKLRALVDEALSERDTTIESTTVSNTVSMEPELFDHRLLYIEEDR